MGWFSRRAPKRASGLGTKSSAASHLLEALEGRTLMANAALPDISSLQNVNHSVVRFQVSFSTPSGRVNEDIDIELFDAEAPITVANFLKYVRDGDYDQSFFHRLARNTDSTPFVLQAGLGRLKSPTTTGAFINQSEQVPTDPAILNEFSPSRSNVSRTLAMAKVGGQVNSATSQWFFNISNNAANLDGQNGGFTVFARVLDDRSWAVVQQMATLSTSNQGSPFNELPVGQGFTGTNATEAQMLMITDAEIIKPANVAEFFRYRYYYPEGFTGGQINEFVPMGNPGDTTVHYQVIARAETRDPLPTPVADFWFRDKVIDHNSIAARKRAGFTVFDFANPSGSLVPKQGKAYAYEVWSTAPVATTLSHYDFGFSTIESFVGGPRATTGLTGDQSSLNWTIPDIRKGGTNRDFLVWQNTTDQTASVTLTFIYDNSSGVSPITLTFPTQPLRRGGLSINDLPQLPAGKFSAVITSDLPIVAALTHYNNTTTSTADNVRGGSTSVGIAGAGSRAGIISLGNINTSSSNPTINDEISVVNPNNGGAIVTLIFTFDDATPDFTTSFAMVAQSRTAISLNSFAALENKRFSVRYSAGVSPLFASIFHVENSDVAANPLAITAAPIHDFGEGFINSGRNPPDVFEQLAIYNPNEVSLRGTDVAANITIKFGYTDGTVVTKTLTIAAGKRVELRLDQDTDLIAQNGLGRFFYSINVVSNVPVIAAMRHYDLSLGGRQASGGGSTIGTQRASTTVPIVRLDNLSSLNTM